jgi:hypothetical protein
MIILYVRHIRFFFYRNWYGIRTGQAWVANLSENIVLIDIGAITIGWRS